MSNSCPDVLFDGKSVLDALSDDARKRTSPENVSDVLDAVVRLIRADESACAKQPSCKTCNDNGLIGGPSFYEPGEGGVPCPDCAVPSASLVPSSAVRIANKQQTDAKLFAPVTPTERYMLAQMKRLWAAVLAPQHVKTEEPALQRYRELTIDGEPETAIERLRFFLAQALRDKPQDWLDVEPFIDALAPAASKDPVAFVKRSEWDDALNKRQSFNGWRINYGDCDMALYDAPQPDSRGIEPWVLSAVQRERDDARAERDEADRRAGAAERNNDALRDEAAKRNDWLRKAKKQAGYDDNVSFDVVWDETLAKSTECERLRPYAEIVIGMEALTNIGWAPELFYDDNGHWKVQSSTLCDRAWSDTPIEAWQQYVAVELNGETEALAAVEAAISVKEE